MKKLSRERRRPLRTEQEDEPNVRVTEVTCQETISQQ